MTFSCIVVLVLVILAGTAATLISAVNPSGGLPPVNGHEVHFNYRETISVWFRSLFYFHPEVALMVNIPVAFKIHIRGGYGSVHHLAVYPPGACTDCASALPLPPLHRVPLSWRPACWCTSRLGSGWYSPRVSAPTANTHIHIAKEEI